jgi:hypothetical protein
MQQSNERDLGRHKKTHRQIGKAEPARYDHLPALFLNMAIGIILKLSRDGRAAGKRNINLPKAWGPGFLIEYEKPESAGLSVLRNQLTDGKRAIVLARDIGDLDVA